MAKRLFSFCALLLLCSAPALAGSLSPISFAVPTGYAAPGVVNIIAGADAQPTITFTTASQVPNGGFVVIRMPTLTLRSAATIAFTASPSSFVALATTNSSLNAIVLQTNAIVSGAVTITFTASATNPIAGTATGSWTVQTWDTTSALIDQGTMAGYTTAAATSSSSVFFVKKSLTTSIAPRISLDNVAPAFTFNVPSNFAAGNTLTIKFPPSTNFTYSSTVTADLRVGPFSTIAGTTLAMAASSESAASATEGSYVYTGTLPAINSGVANIYMHGGAGLTTAIQYFAQYGGTLGPFVVSVSNGGTTLFTQTFTSTIPKGAISTDCTDSTLTLKLSSQTYNAPATFTATFKVINAVAAGGSVSVTMPTEIPSYLSGVTIVSNSVSSSYFGTASISGNVYTLPVSAPAGIPAGTIVSVSVNGPNSGNGFLLPSSGTQLWFSLTTSYTGGQTIDSARFALTIGPNAVDFCAASVYRSASLVTVKFAVDSVSSFVINSYGTKFIAAATLVMQTPNATSAQNFTIVPSTTVAGSIMYTVAVATSISDNGAVATKYGQRLANAVSLATSADGVKLYQYLNSSSIVLNGATIAMNMGGLLDSSYTPTVQLVSSISACSDGSYQVQCTPCGSAKCIKLWPNAFSAAIAVRPVAALVALLAAMVAFA